MLAILAAGLVGAIVRIAFAIDNADAHTAVDSQVYRRIARHLVNGHGYAIRDFHTHQLVPTASHPPAFPFLLAGLDVVGLTSKLQQRVVLGAVAAIGVVLTGLVARHVAGNAAGVVAAFIAALHPLWFQHAAMGVSESLYLVVVPLLLLVAVHAADRPTWKWMAALGACVGLAALTRSEGALFLVVLVVPARDRRVPRLEAAHHRDARRGRGDARGRSVPWLIRNYREFDGLTMSTNQGVTLAGGWCDSTLTRIPGGWDLYCSIPEYDAVRTSPPPAGHDSWDELSIDRELTQPDPDATSGTTWATFPGWWPHALGRTFGVYSLDSNDIYGQLVFDYHEGRDKGTQRVGQILHLLLLPFAIYGAVRLTRRYLPVLLAGPIVAAISASVFYGSTRMRVSAEPAIVILAAVGLVAVARHVGDRRRRRAGAATATRPPPTPDANAVPGAGNCAHLHGSSPSVPARAAHVRAPRRCCSPPRRRSPWPVARRPVRPTRPKVVTIGVIAPLDGGLVSFGRGDPQLGAARGRRGQRRRPAARLEDQGARPRRLLRPGARRPRGEEAREGPVGRRRRRARTTRASPRRCSRCSPQAASRSSRRRTRSPR